MPRAFDLSQKIIFSLPLLSWVILLFVSMANFNISGFSTLFPAVGVITIFYWIIYAPIFVPKWQVFAIGLVQDMLLGTPVGVSSLLYVVLWTIIFSQRRVLARQPFPALWGVFVVANFLFLFAYLSLFTMVTKNFPGYELPIQNAVITCLFYPVFHKFYNYLFKHIVRSI